MISIPTIQRGTKCRYDTYSGDGIGICTTCGSPSCEEHKRVFFMGQGFTCANHTDEEVALDQIGWNNFICPKCGRDYSIGRKISSR